MSPVFVQYSKESGGNLYGLVRKAGRKSDKAKYSTRTRKNTFQLLTPSFTCDTIKIQMHLIYRRIFDLFTGKISAEYLRIKCRNAKRRIAALLQLVL